MTPLAAAVGVVGALCGAALPAVVARIPDRPPVQDEPAIPPYRVLAAAPRLRPVLALTTATAWGLVAWARWESPADLPAYLLVATLGVAMAYVDLRIHRLPDRLTAAAFGGGTVLLTAAATTTGQWGSLGRALLGAAATTAFYLVLALARPADLGLGDVKLAATVGLVLGWVGWSAVVTGTLLAFVLGGLTGLVLMAAGRAGRRTAIPFGPPMLAGALLAVLWSRPLVDAYLGR
jgi:leader peptidase (prepilin peptidase)/N-methyltransferase